MCIRTGYQMRPCHVQCCSGYVFRSLIRIRVDECRNTCLTISCIWIEWIWYVRLDRFFDTGQCLLTETTRYMGRISSPVITMYHQRRIYLTSRRLSRFIPFNPCVRSLVMERRSVTTYLHNVFLIIRIILNFQQQQICRSCIIGRGRSPGLTDHITICRL